MIPDDYFENESSGEVLVTERKEIEEEEAIDDLFAGDDTKFDNAQGGG